MTVRTKILLLPLSCNDTPQEVLRTITKVTPVCGLEVGKFTLAGSTRYAMRSCYGIRGSYVWYQVPCNFPALRALERVEPPDAPPDPPPARTVVCAACRHPGSGRIVTGARHYDSVMRGQMEAAEGTKSWLGCEQGFIDQHGVFLTREEAMVIALDGDQIRRRVGGDSEQLFSENIY